MKLAGSYTFLALIAFVLVITPVLQGNQASNNSRESCECCNCCCGCGEQETENVQAANDNAGCGCQMTDSESPFEVPLEGQVQTVNHDAAADLSAQTCAEFGPLTAESSHLLSYNRINDHGPPLYKINSSYLI